MAPILGIWASSRPTIVPDLGSMFPLGVFSVPSAGASTIQFTNIPSTYQHLQIRGIVRSSNSSADILMARFNGVSSSGNYRAHQLAGYGSTIGSSFYGETDRIGLGDIPGSAQGSNVFAGFVLDILDYANTNKNRVSRILSGYDANGSGVISYNSGLYLSTTALSSITISNFFGNFVQNSQIALYGIK